jgi:pyridoxal phosphate enzyme (YggS family)
MLILPQNSAAAQALGMNLQRVREQIARAAEAARRTVDSITLVAVSKGHGVELMRRAVQLGVGDFGESYVQEALPKIEALRDTPSLTWHFIGRLQANKTRPIAERFAWVHGVDRLKIAERLSAQRPHYAPALNVCLEVSLAGEATKGGIEPGEALELAAAVQALPQLRLRGLMCMLPAGLGTAAAREAFAALRELRARINATVVSAAAPALDSLSMGMSEDFREAILEGATLVRIGSAIFGPRAPDDAAAP